MLLALISQLRIGMDLSRVVLPVFILEPRSMLERVTDFLSHPALLFGYVPSLTTNTPGRGSVRGRRIRN